LETLPPLLPPPPSQDEREKEDQLTLAKVGGWVVLDSLFFSSKVLRQYQSRQSKKREPYIPNSTHTVCVCVIRLEKKRKMKGE
jgi:hypothetical protein